MFLLMRCAGQMMKGPAILATGALVATGAAATIAVGTGLAGAALLARRLREERHGWRAGAHAAEPASEPTSSAPPPEPTLE